MDTGESMDILVDDEILEYIAYVPRKEIGTYQKAIVQAIATNDKMLMKSIRAMLRLTASIEGKRSEQLVQAMQASKLAMMNEDMAVLQNQVGQHPQMNQQKKKKVRFQRLRPGREGNE